MSQAGNLVTSGGGGGGITSVETDFGTAIPAGGVLQIITANSIKQAGSTVLFSGSGNTVLLNVTDSLFNTIIGEDSGNNTLAGSQNVIFGASSGLSLNNGSGNLFIGNLVASNLTDGTNNVIFGNAASFFSGVLVV